MTNTNKVIQRLAINIKELLKVHNLEYSQAFIDVNRIIILAGENTKPIRQLGIGIKSNEYVDKYGIPHPCTGDCYRCGTSLVYNDVGSSGKWCPQCETFDVEQSETEDPADKDDRLYHEEQDIIAMNKAKEIK